MSKIIFVVDHIENNIAIIERLDTQEKKEVNITSLPPHIQDGSLLSYEDNKYVLNKKEENNRRKNLRNRFNNLKKNTSNN